MILHAWRHDAGIVARGLGFVAHGVLGVLQATAFVEDVLSGAHVCFLDRELYVIDRVCGLVYTWGETGEC